MIPNGFPERHGVSTSTAYTAVDHTFRPTGRRTQLHVLQRNALPGPHSNTPAPLLPCTLPAWLPSHLPKQGRLTSTAYDAADRTSRGSPRTLPKQGKLTSTACATADCTSRALPKQAYVGNILLLCSRTHRRERPGDGLYPARPPALERFLRPYLYE